MDVKESEVQKTIAQWKARKEQEKLLNFTSKSSQVVASKKVSSFNPKANRKSNRKDLDETCLSRDFDEESPEVSSSEDEKDIPVRL